MSVDLSRELARRLGVPVQADSPIRSTEDVDREGGAGVPKASVD